jgi:hypothetical protein
MPKLEEVLRANGYTDSDIEAMAPMLQDQKFRGSLETHFSRLEAERDDYKSKHEAWDKWREETANPAIAAAERTAAEARLDAARYREEAKIARDYGLLPKEPDAPLAPAPPSVSGAFNPKDHKLVTEDDLRNGYAQFAEAEGRAIALAADLNEEYRYLSGGKSLYEYEGEGGKRGMTALREEAVRAKKQLDQYVAEKFDFAAKRRAQQETIQKAHDDKIREEERAAMAAKYGNPMLRQPTLSRQPFIPAKAGDAKFPWEQLPQDRRNARLERALKTQFTGQPN